jgi:hypothetical protein
MARLFTMALLALALATPCAANHYDDYAVQTVYDGGHTYVLYASGNIYRDSGWGRRELIDDGTGTRMIAAGHGRLYCLKNNGNIWMFDQYRWRMIDNGTGTSRIWVEWGTVYCQKNNGRVWRCVDPYSMQWQPTDGGWGRRSETRARNFDRLHGN